MSIRQVDMPQSIEAEQAVIGGLMLTPAAIVKISDWLDEADFHRKDHRVLFRAIKRLWTDGVLPDAVTLTEWLDSNGLASQAGGTSYVLHLANTTPSAANIVAYAEIVKEKARLRHAIDTGNSLSTAAAGKGACSREVVGLALQGLSELQGTHVRGGLQAAKPLVQEWFADLQSRYDIGDTVTGLETPWKEINQATHGFQPGELTVIAARPNMGKSVMGVQLAAHSALRGIRTALFSLEMTETQVVRRAISCIGRIDHDWLLAPVGDDESRWARVLAATTTLAEAQLYVDQSPGLSIEEITARACRAHLQKPIGLIIVDHLHEMKIDGDRAIYDIGRNAQGLKALGKQFRCPVVVLAQLNRAVAGRTDKRPTMTDLRSSGEIEQKADVILFLHREDAYDADTHLRGVVEVEVGKGRDIRTGGRVYLANRYDQMRLDDWDGPLPAAPVSTSARRSRGFSPRATAPCDDA